jgi:hypothetical protein
MKVFKTMQLILATVVITTGTLVLHAQENAGVQMMKPGNDISGGKVFALEVTLDKPLPPETSIIVPVKPDNVSQLLVLSGASTDDPAHTKIVVKTTLPNVLVPGKWAVNDVFIVLPGTNIWQPLAHNDLKFDIQGNHFLYQKRPTYLSYTDELRYYPQRRF